MTYLQPFASILFLLAFSTCSRESAPDPVVMPLNWITAKVTAPNTEQAIFFSSSADSEVSFHVFLPDDYHNNPTQNFPVIYWLHGSGGGEDGILPLVNHFKSAMEQAKIPPAIVVFPNGLPHGMWCNSKDGKQPVESMFIEDLIPYVDAHYRTLALRNGRIVEGFSMGGYGAARLGFKYAHLFGGFSMWGAGPLQLDFSIVAQQNQQIQPRIFREVYGEDMAYFEAQSPWRLAEQYGAALPALTPKRIVVGKLDFTYPANNDFRNHLTALGIPHQFREFDNIGHTAPALFTAMGESNWVFYNAVFE